MARQVIARHDPALQAWVHSSTPLRYGAGADPALDRPAHVRAGSSLVRLGDWLVVVQDDAGFVALVDPDGTVVEAVTLPAGPDGLRQHDDVRGTKHLKLDLEASVVVDDGSGELLLAFGSGSTPRREQLLLAGGLAGPTPAVELRPAPELYAALRAAHEFAGSELNIEGALFVEGVIRLFGRGNGAPRGGLAPLDATCDLDWPALASYLRGGGPPPSPQAYVQYDLGQLGGLRLGFTDATLVGGTMLFSAAAEDSPDAVRDGRVAGSAIGVVDPGGSARWAPLSDAEGNVFAGKAEGLHPAGDPRELYVVVDRDDPGAPTELCRVVLRGPWGLAPHGT